MSNMVTPPGTNNPYDPKHPPRCAPFWGLPAHWSIADLQPKSGSMNVVLSQIVADTTSGQVDLGARGVKIGVQLETNSVTCTLQLLDKDSNVLKSWDVDSGHTVFYAGNLEMVDLGGEPFLLSVTSLSGGWITVAASPMN